MSLRIGDAIGNTIKLNNNKDISDLIVFKNKNLSGSEYKNLTINYDDNYIFGLINDNFEIRKFDETSLGLFNETDYYININNTNLNLKNNNINLYFDNSLIISDNLVNIINFNKTNQEIILNNYTINISLDTNEFNILDNTSGTNLVNFKKSGTKFNCDLKADNILVDNIRPLNTTGVTITDFSIEKKKFDDVIIGNINSIENKKTPLIINKNIFNNNETNNSIEINRYDKENDNIEETEATKIFTVNNKGYINLGNCYDVNNKSYINIDNYNEDYVLNNNYNVLDNDLKLILNYKGDFEGDTLSINRYGNISIGNENNLDSLLSINRNDDRQNLDTNNINNINIDNPLLKLNINYDHKNNYRWHTVDRFDLYFQNIFTSIYFQNIESVADTDPFLISYRNNYDTNFSLEDPSRKFYYTHEQNKYFFLNAYQINSILDFDYTKLNIEKTNNKTPFVDNVYDSTQTYNILYNRLNLKTNDKQVSYDFKTISWQSAISTGSYTRSHIIYPDKIILNDDLGNILKEYNLEIVSIRNDISQAQRLITDKEVTNYNYENFYLFPIGLGESIDPSDENSPGLTDGDILSDKILLIDYLADRNIFKNTITGSQIKAEVLDTITNSYFKDFTCIRHLELIDGVETPLFAIHISKKVYDKFNNYRQKFKDYRSTIIPKANFINFSSNNDYIAHITSKGTISFNQNLPIENEDLSTSEYSIYSKNKKSLFEKIETNSITTIDDIDSLNFNNKNLENIGLINFNENQIFNISNLILYDVTNNNNNININNSKINIETTINGLKWQLSLILPDENIYTNINNDSFKNILETKIKQVNNNNEINFIEYDTLPYTGILLDNEYLNNNIEEKKIYTKKELNDNNIDINHNNYILKNSKYYIPLIRNIIFIKKDIYEILNQNNILDNKNIYQKINIYDKELYLIHDYENNYINDNYYPNIFTTIDKLYTNKIIDIDSHNNHNVHPSISIYGSNASYILKSYNNSNLSYMSSIKYNGFKKLENEVGGFDDKKNIYEISYIKQNNDIYDNKFHTYNTNHILQHIGDDYNMITLGENYNICIDNKGPEIIDVNSANFGQYWMETASPIGGAIELVDEIVQNILKNRKELTFPEFFDLKTRLNKTKFLTHDYFKVIINGVTKYFIPRSNTHTELLENNTSNSLYKISLGIPFKDEKINNTENGYMYNYPRYFKEVIKETSDYMLNIYGNTKIYGIDGTTNAMSIKINESKGLDNEYKINASIGSNLILDQNNTTFNVGGNTYSDKLYYKDIDNTTYLNVSDIHTTVVNDIIDNIFPQELQKSVLHTSQMNDNTENGVFNIDLIPNIPVNNLALPDPPDRQVRIKDYLHPILDGFSIDTYEKYKNKFPSDNDYEYYIDELDNYNSEIINRDYNGYHYFKFDTDNLHTQENKLYNLNVKDSIICDVIIIGGGGGGGKLTPGLKWKNIGNILPENTIELTTGNIQSLLEKFSSLTVGDVIDLTIEDLTTYALVDNVLYNSYLYDVSRNNYFVTTSGGGGAGGQDRIISNVIIPKDTNIEIFVGHGGIGDGISETSISTNGNFSKFNNEISQGGLKNFNFFGEGESGNFTIADTAYKLFHEQYPNEGQLVNTIYKYFAGDGGTQGYIGGSGGGGGVISGNSFGDATSRGGGGGYSQVGGWGKGADGIVLLRYRFKEKFEYFTEPTPIEDLSNTYLEFNWQQNKWVLNQYIADTSNIVTNKIQITSNNLITNINNTSNYSLILSDDSSNLILDSIINTSNYTEDVYSNILYLSNDTSNYFDDIKDNIKNLDSTNITKGELNIDRLPLIPFSKFENLEINSIYSPKINHNIIENTNYYKETKDYVLSSEDNEIKSKYIILTYDENDQYSTNQTEYFVEFLSDCKIDVLLVGGGGGGGGTESINSGGGGGGGFIQARNINITRGDQFTMKVGNGGASKTDGFNTEAFGAIAFGGKHGNSDNPPELGQGGDGGTTSISNSIDIFKNKVISMFDGGKGGTSSRASDFDNNLVSGQSGNNTNFYYDVEKENEINEYFWGGGGGATRWNNNGTTLSDVKEGLKYGFLPEGGLGGGGAGAFKYNDTLDIENEIADGGIGFNNGDSIIVNRTDNLLFKTGGNGGKGTGGGGGGGFDINTDGIINGAGGHGGSGIIIIKYYDVIIPTVGNRLKGYLGYNFNSSIWEMNSLDLLNLDINLDEVYEEINTKDQAVREYVDSKFTLDLYPQTAIAVPLSWITNGAIVDHAITSANIFGYAGKGRPLNGETPDGDGLINLPAEAYTDPTNIYYQHLIKNEKFALASLTNNNIADGTITFDKFYGQLEASKISNGVINFSDISGTITSPITIFTDDSTQKISADSITSAIVDLNIIDFSTSIIQGTTTIISDIDNTLKISINKLNNVLIDIINIDTSTDIIGTSTIISSTNSIPISILKDIKVDITSILNSDSADFLLPTVTLLGDIPKNYLTNVNVPVTNISETSLVNTSVQLIYSGPTGLKWTYYSQTVISPILINNLEFEDFIKAFYLPYISTINISEQQFTNTGITTLTKNHYININNNIYYPEDISPDDPTGLVWIHSGYIIPTQSEKIAITNTELSEILTNIIKSAYIDNEILLTQTQKDSFLFPNLTHNHFIYINNEYFTPKDESRINPNLIKNLYLSANQIDTTIVDAFLNNVILNFDQSKLDPSVLAEVSVTPNDIDFTEGSLNAIIDTSHIPSGLKWKYIGSSTDIPDIVKYGRELIQGEVVGDITGLKSSILPPEFKTIFTNSEWLQFGIELRHNDYIIIGGNYFAPVSSLINPHFINPITILPTDLDNFNGNYTNKLQNVTINTETIKINPHLIDNISLTPDQIEVSLDLSKNIYWLDTGSTTIPTINQATLLVNSSLSELLNQKISQFTLLQTEWDTVLLSSLTLDHYINIKNNYYFPQSTNGLVWNNSGITIPSGKIEITNSVLYDLLTKKMENIYITSSEINEISITSLYIYNYILADNGHYFIPHKTYDSLLNKLEYVTINTTDVNKINPSIVSEITLTADQFNESGKFGSVILSDLSAQSINPSLISSVVTIDSIHIKTGFIDPENQSLGKHRLPSDLNYNFTSQSIDPTLIPPSVNIDGTMLITTNPTKKLENVTIINNVDTSVISDGGGLGLGPRIEGTLTSTSGSKINNVVITSSFDVSFINNATITDSATLTTNFASTISGRAFIFGDIPVNVINDAIVNINNTTTKFITTEGNNHYFSGNTVIDGDIDASFVNNANITLGTFNGLETKFKTGTTITGNVTVTGVVDASHIAQPVTLNIQGGNFDGNDIANNTINSDKLTDNLNINVNTINFSDGTSMTSAVSSDILTGTEIAGLYVSKFDFNTYFTKPSVNSQFQFRLFNTSDSLETTNSSLYLFDQNNLSISTNLPFNSFIDNNSQLIINSKNSTSYFHIKSFYTDDYGADNIGIKNSISNSTIGGSVMNFKNSRFCITLNPLGSTSQEINVFEFTSDSNFSHNELHIPKLVFSDGTEMTTAAISLLDDNNQLIMNNSISGFNYNDSDVTGEGFIHCNGLHAQFDITAFSSTTQSDSRLKKDIKNIEYSDRLLELNPVSFKWIDPNKSNTSNVGFIAQEVEKIFPELVKNGIDNYKSVNYTGLIPYLVKHIQHLENRIKDLENKL